MTDAGKHYTSESYFLKLEFNKLGLPDSFPLF